jgi:hemerythrin superfamily protein
VIRVLLEQHIRIRDLALAVRVANSSELRTIAFNQLRTLLAVHETAEEMVLRPMSRRADHEIAAARNREEHALNQVLSSLEHLPIDSDEFGTRFAVFERSVLAHAEAEEEYEFPAVLAITDEVQRQRLGAMLITLERVSPTHPHPITAGSTPAQWAAAPFTAMLDRTRDALGRLMTS